MLLPLIGTRLVASALVSLLYDSIMGTLTIFSLIFILLLVLRRTWAAAAVASPSSRCNRWEGPFTPRST